jgi:hypothetical protein
MTQLQLVAAYIISNIVAVVFLLISLFGWKQLARVLFAALFLWAGWKNWTVAHSSPGDYLNYSKYAIDLYRKFIVGPFSNHVQLIVSVIAVCQVFIGLGLLGGAQHYGLPALVVSCF